MDVCQMFCPFVGRLTRGMKRKTEKNQSAHSRQRVRCLRLRAHTSAEGSPTCEQRNIRNPSAGLQDPFAPGRVPHPWTVRPLPTLFHIEKLIKQCGNAAFEKPRRDRGHKRMCHSRPCAMR